VSASSSSWTILSGAGDATVSTQAGTGLMGATNGPAASASFTHPAGVALDAAGTIYVADTYNNRIRAIDALATLVSSAAGQGWWGSADGSAGMASFYHPEGLAVSATRLIIADRYNNLIRVLHLK